MNLDTSFWIGLALSIPLSIAGNLLTPWVRNYLAESSEARSRERIQELLSELSELDEFEREPLKLVIYLLMEILILLFIAASMTAFYWLLEWASQFLPTSVLNLNPGRLAAILIAIMIAKYALDAGIKARNLRHASKHRTYVRRRLNELGYVEA